jgi:hypothetical protein
MTSSIGKQAVLVIHGVGEQRPMSTLRALVEAVWSTDREVHHRHGVPTVWSKPDTISGSYELRRLATGRNKHDVRTDFFELYWAYRMDGTTWGHVLAWARTLLWRNPRTLPRHLHAPWLLLVLMGLVVVFFAVQASLPEGSRLLEWPRWASAASAIFTALVAAPVVKKVIGDAARYFDAAPPNIKRRQEIRTSGVEVLKKLHTAGYDRIVVVGHSLGSVIGYDILTHAWAVYHDGRTKPRGPYAALDELERLATAGVAFDLETWRKAQRRYAEELREIGCSWRVTDFVTFGCPLTHAEALLASSRTDLALRQESRELATCPPVLEGKLFSYPKNRKNRTPHHAAVFAPTRWTNLYFPARFVLWGDFVGGPIAPLFGPGIRDVPVRTRQRGGFLSHTLYWRSRPGDQAHILECRKAIDLLDRDRHAVEG